MKFLVGVSPAGSVRVVSKAWGGRATDKRIVRHEDLPKRIRDSSDSSARELVEHVTCAKKMIAHRVIMSFLLNDGFEL